MTIIGSAMSAAELVHEARVVERIISKDVSSLLDIGSDKPPKAAAEFKKRYNHLDVYHYKDKGTSTKDSMMKNFPGVKLINSFSELQNEGQYDIVTAYYTLHEFERPVEVLERALSKLKTGGILVVKEYNAIDFAEHAKTKDWNLPQKRSNFSYIFNNNIEEGVLGYTNGKPLTLKKIDKNIGKGLVIEPECVKQHIRFGKDYYYDMFSSFGVVEQDITFNTVMTPWGRVSKSFFYVGRKE